MGARAGILRGRAKTYVPGSADDGKSQVAARARVAAHGAAGVRRVVPNHLWLLVEKGVARPVEQLDVALRKGRAANQIQRAVVDDGLEALLQQRLQALPLGEHHVALQRDLHREVAVIVRGVAHAQRGADGGRGHVRAVVAKGGRSLGGHVEVVGEARHVGVPRAAGGGVAVEKRVPHLVGAEKSVSWSLGLGVRAQTVLAGAIGGGKRASQTHPT